MACEDCPEYDCIWCRHEGDDHRDVWDQIFRTGERD